MLLSKGCENHLLQERLTSLEFSEKADYRITIAFMLMRCRQLASDLKGKREKSKSEHIHPYESIPFLSLQHIPRLAELAGNLKVSEIKQF